MWGTQLSALLLFGVICGISTPSVGGGPAFVPPGREAFAPPPPDPTPAASVWFNESDGRFGVLVPSDWSIRPGSDGSVNMWPPSGNSDMGIRSKAWCIRGTGTEAVAILRETLRLYESNTGFNIEAPLSPRTIKGHTAAETWYTHFLANGKAFASVTVILAPEWSAVWIFDTLVHDASEMARWPVMNETLNSFTVFQGPAPSVPLHASSHFQVSVPGAWYSYTNTSIGGTTTDVSLSDAKGTILMAIVSESGSLQGTDAEARAILQRVISNLSSQHAFRVIEPVSDMTVDAHPGARALVAWQPSTSDVQEHIAVVVGAEWSTSWAIVGSALSQRSGELRACFDETLRTLTIDRADVGQFPAGWIVPYQEWLLAGGLVATAVEGIVLAYLMMRTSRRKR